MKISVVIPVYNTEKYLKKCIDSVIGQSYTDIEVIIVNDGSTDNSMKIIEEYNKNDDRITVFDILNAGVSNARNIGIDNASGEYICFIDSDDFWYDGFLSKMQEAIKNCDMVICNYNIVADTYVRENVLPMTYDDELNVDEELIFDILSNKTQIGVFLSNKLYKTEAIKKSGVRFEQRREIYAEDAMFTYKTIKHFEKISIVRDSLYGYYQRETSVSHTYKENLTKRCENFLKNIDSYYDRKYTKAIKMRAFLYFIEILYNEKQKNYKSFKKAVNNDYFKSLIDGIDTDNLSKMRKIVYILRNNALMLYLIYKISGRDE